jgi:hypothetical protein
MIAGVAVFGVSTGRASPLSTTGVITSNTAVKLCPSSTVVSGLNVDVEERGYVDEVALLCWYSNGTVTSGPVIGIPGITPTGFRRSSCGPAMVAVGIYGRSGDVVDAIGDRCRRPGQPAMNAPLRGGSGGARRGPFDCPEGERLIGLQGKSVSDYYGAPDVSSVTGICSTSAHPVVPSWTGSGPAASSVSVTGSSGLSPSLAYSINPAGYNTRTWRLTTTTARAGTLVLEYHYQGFHAWFEVTVFVDAIIVHDGHTARTGVISAGPVDCCNPPSGGFDYSGTVRLKIRPGDTYGFEFGGSNFDSNNQLKGVLQVTQSAGS